MAFLATENENRQLLVKNFVPVMIQRILSSKLSLIADALFDVFSPKDLSVGTGLNKNNSLNRE